jgi:3-phosphoshikimate 1-carboxyvinyltransferase
MSQWAAGLPETITISPLSRPRSATVRVPGSKSITNRGLILAALSDPWEGCEIKEALQSEDTEVMVQCLQALGFPVKADWPSIYFRQREYGRRIPAENADLYVANSGTSMRFLTALVALGKGRYRLDGVSRMRERPMEDLLIALNQLGVRAYSEGENGYPPVIVETEGLNGGRTRIRGNISSQFLSALLMIAPLSRKPVTIEIDGPLVSKPYVVMTMEMMKAFGARLDTEELTRKLGVPVEEYVFPSYFQLPTLPWYCLKSFEVEPDASAASYFFAAAAITGGEVTVAGLGVPSIQGDVRFIDVLLDMGCRVVRSPQSLAVRGGPLRGIDVDMNDISDTVMTLAAVACFANGPTTIRNVAHIRYKETDRLTALATELRRVGAGVDEFADGLTITPAPLHGAVIETYNDHRIAMSMALVGLKVPGIVIKNPACVAKTYPNFFHDLEQLR